MDVLETIRNLRKYLWEKYGNVLEKPLNQDEVHMTYYVGEVLRHNGYEHTIIDGACYYTEEAMQRAFVAGRRVGWKEQGVRNNAIHDNVIDDLISELEEMKNG